MRVEQIADNVHLVTGTNVNWALVCESDALTVVDAGYPNDGRHLLESIKAIGRRPQDVQAVLLTHAHLDHMGGIPTLLAEHPARVLTGEVEAAHAHRDFIEQVTPARMFAQCYRPRGVVWVAQTLRAALPHIAMSVDSAEAVPAGVELDLPGRPVPTATPGHTSGHTAYLLESAGIVFTGDALVTDHSLLSGPPRPQFLPGFFSEDEAQMRQSLSTLATLPADTLVPGHGPIHRGSMAQIVADVEARLGD